MGAMNVLAATQALLGLMATAQNLMANATQISAMIAKAQAEGRTDFTAEEWMVVTAADDVARGTLVDMITKALTK